MYNPVILSLIVSVVIAIISEIYYKIKYRENIDDLDINKKIKTQISLCIGVFAIIYIYSVFTNNKKEITENISNIEDNIDLDVDIDNIEPTKVPF